jgi:hypothetical protein
VLFNFTPGISGQALAGLISSASCPGGRPLSSAPLQSPEQGCSRDKTCRRGGGGGWSADICRAGQASSPVVEEGLRSKTHSTH